MRKNDASLLTKANVEAMSDGEEPFFIFAGVMLTGTVGRPLAWLIQWIMSESDDAPNCRYHSSYDLGNDTDRGCRLGHNITFRPKCNPRSDSDKIAVKDEIENTNKPLDFICRDHYWH